MITNTKLTLYNKFYDGGEDCNIWRRTLIDSVAWQDEKNIIVADGGIVSADTSKIYIPKSAKSQDKTYLKPIEYVKSSEKDKYYTFQNGDVVVRGDIDYPLSEEKGKNLADFRKRYDDVMTITGISDNRYGGEELQHFELEVK